MTKGHRQHTPGNPYSRRPKPTMAVTGAMTMGLTCLAAMPHMPLKPRMMFRAEPAMKAPCVALIACTNLCTWVGSNKPSLLFFREKKRRMQIDRDVGKKGKEERRRGKKRGSSTYLMRVSNCHDARSIDD
jgi:hypothetical protein